MKHGFLKVATASPKVSVADCDANINEIINIANKAHTAGVKLLTFPELSVTGYTCADLFNTDVLLKSAEVALDKFLSNADTGDMISIIGLPLIVNEKIYNSAVICQNKQILGAVPKVNLPNYAEFSEARTFTPAKFDDEIKYIKLCGNKVPFGNKIIFRCNNMPLFKLGVEICEDLWVSAPPSSRITAAGATVIANPSASNEIIGKADYRRLLVTSQAARTISGYIYSDCYRGESTTDLVFSGHSIIAEGSEILAERLPFEVTDSLYLATELDLEKIAYDRRKTNTFVLDTNGFTYIDFSLATEETEITREIERMPFIPKDNNELKNRCETILTIQAEGLIQRITRAYAKKCVIGISGGLDSCLALLVTARAMDMLNRPKKDILCVTMPCFGTTKRTKSNAQILCEELGVDFKCVNISESVRSHFNDIGHDEANKNVVYENAQARERTQVIMDIANMTGGIVIGTGDLSELALGWATYNGDHMSMYGVNGAVPKTLVRHIVSYCADIAEKDGQKRLCDVLRDIVDTPVSPELLPSDTNGEIAQKTEDIVGPYEIHDFYLYNMLRFGSAPDKLYRMAQIAFDGIYDSETLLKWLKNFVRRFFAQQFKRSCLPDGPKVGTVGLSPRGDLRMPSDALSNEWVKIIEKL